MVHSVEHHRATAILAQRQASVARELAVELGGRESRVRQRLTPVMQRHTDDVWSSRAASHSRLRVRSVQVATLLAVTDDLALVRLALDRRRDELEAQARAEHRQADLLEAALAATSIENMGTGGLA
jgi:hypothetical protein